ncbi:type I polyketide synthase, partial [Streptomonospora sediminis]
LVVERLSDARRLGHPVLAVVRGSAINQDGASNGLTAPNGPSQRRVIARALADAGVSAAEVDAVEAHGTGTALGDPIEAQALLAAYGADRPGDAPLWLGAVKSNIGHTQAAAGVAGVIKMVQAMRHGRLPKTLHAEVPSPHVDWSAGAVEVLSQPRTWESNGRPRRAGVSSFGISGTNAHVVLEQGTEPPQPPERPDPAEPTDAVAAAPVPWVVSGASAAGLAGQAERLAASGGGAGSVLDTGWSLAVSRAGLEHRAVVVGCERDELLAGLGVVAGSARDADAEGTGLVVRGRVAGEGRVGLVFSGQGSQRAGMGRGLYERFPVFAAAVDEVCAHSGDLPLRDAMFSGAGLAETRWAQPALLAFQVGVVRLLESWGVAPAAVMGHSIGEVTAAWVAGVFPLADACALVAARGRLMQATPAGAMAAVRASEAEMAPLVGARSGAVVAAVNGPASVVVSGEPDAVRDVVDQVASWGRRVSWLQVERGFHSPLMDGVLAEFRQVVEGLHFSAPSSAPVLVSNVSGGVAGAEMAHPGYWVDHVRSPVRFADGVAALAGAGVDVVAEVGPRRAVGGDVAEVSGLGVVGVGHEWRDCEVHGSVGGLGGLWVRGVEPDWNAVFGAAPTRVALPTYAFQRDRFWPRPGTRDPDRRLGGSKPENRLWELVECEDVSGVAELLGADDDEPVAGFEDMVGILGAWRRGARESAMVTASRYGIRWISLSLETGGRAQGLWAVVTGEECDRDAQRLADALRSRGAEAVVVGLGVGVSRTAVAERIRAELGDREPELAGVVGKLGCGTDGDGALAGLWELVVLRQGLADLGVGVPLWCVTVGGVSVDRSDAVYSPVSAGLWG